MQEDLERKINVMHFPGGWVVCVQNYLFIFLLLSVLGNMQDQTQAYPRLLNKYSFSRKLFALPGRDGWGARYTSDLTFEDLGNLLLLFRHETFWYTGFFGKMSLPVSIKYFIYQTKDWKCAWSHGQNTPWKNAKFSAIDSLTGGIFSELFLFHIKWSK